MFKKSNSQAQNMGEASSGTGRYAAEIVQSLRARFKLKDVAESIKQPDQDGELYRFGESVQEDQIGLARVPRKLWLIGNWAVKKQYTTVVATSVLVISCSVGVAFLANSMTSQLATLRVKVDGLVQKVERLNGEVTSAAAGDAQAFLQAESTQGDLSALIVGLAPHAGLKADRLAALPPVDQPSDDIETELWKYLVGKDIDLTQRLETVLELQDSYNKVLANQPQFGAFGLITGALKTKVVAAREILDEAMLQAPGNKGLDLVAEDIRALQVSVEKFASAGANTLDMAVIENLRKKAVADLPVGASGSFAATLARLTVLLMNDLPSLQAVIQTNFAHLSQDLVLETAKTSGQADAAIALVSEPIDMPLSIKMLWGSSAGLLTVGFGLIALLLVINANAAGMAAYLAKKEQEETDSAVRSIMNELRPISRGDLLSRVTVTEHVTGSIADRINMTADSIQETIQQAKVSTREAESSIHEIFEQAEKAHELTNSASRQAQASRSASKEGALAVSMAVERTQRQRTSMQEVAKRVKHLGEVAQSITKVTDLIEEVTGKTEVLALNTSLKAADAGDEGAAFRVIANEIRSLTNHTKRSLSDIALAVQSMQGETQAVIQTVEGVTAEVVDAAKYWEGAMSSLTSIQTLSVDMDKLMDSVRLASENQAKSASDAVGTISRLTDSVAKFRTEETEDMPQPA